MDVCADPAALCPTECRLMLVDDTPENLALLKNMLGDQGFELYAFPSGALALRAAERQVPDLVLLDISMPDMDGYEVCRRFKADPRLADVPIIFLTAMTEVSDKLRAFELGAVDFVTKPFHVAEVQARVALHLQLRQLRRRLEYQNRHLQALVDAKVAELAEAHRESRRRLAEIAHLNRTLTSSVYSAAIAHDLRQPLAAILSNAEAAELFLERDPPALDEVREILADIRRDDQRAGQIIERMRALLNKTHTEIEAIELNGLVADVAAFLGSEARMRELRLVCDTGPAPLTVLGDRVQLQQVLINLALNGMDAMADTAPAERLLRLQVRRAGPGLAQLSVIDAGCGFADIGHAFESFFTTKTQGMGMGLAISAALVNAHEGRIWADNNPGLGASVHVALPLKEAM